MDTGEIRKALGRRLARRIAFFVGFAATAAILIAATGGTTSTDSSYHRQERQVSPVAQLLEAHDCWSGEGPEGVIPGHAVYTLPGSTPTYGPSQIGFDIWLNGKPGSLHGFCR